MQAIAERGHSVLVQLDGNPGSGPFDQTRGVVVDTRRATVSEPAFVQGILARGYWTPFQGDPAPVLALASSALTAAGLVANWDETKHPRHPAGTREGGRFTSVRIADIQAGDVILPNKFDEHFRIVPGEPARVTQVEHFAPGTAYDVQPGEDAERAAEQNTEGAVRLTMEDGSTLTAQPNQREKVLASPDASVTVDHWSEQSPGHVTFADDWEYFRGPNGDIYRAPRDNPFDRVTGYRTGARFEFPFWQLARREEQGVYPFDQQVFEGLGAAGFDETKHARYPKGTKQRGREGGGRFAPKGAGGSEKESPDAQDLIGSWLNTPAQTAQDAYYKATRPREAVQIARGWLEENGFKDEAKGNAVQVVQAMQDHYPDGYEFFLSINDMHKEDFRRNYMKGGDYTPERADLHNAIRASYLRTGQVPTEGKPTALFLAGGSGAGKSSILGKQTPDGQFTGGQDIGAPEHAVYINPDDIKEILPESQAMKEANDPRWAALSHEESSDVAARLRKDAEQAGFPMVVDGTGDSAPGKFLGKIADAEKAGYDTKVVFVDIPTDEAIKRANERAISTGRKVSTEQIRAIHQNVTQRHQEWRDKVGNWEVWANDDPEHGGRRKIAQRVNGGEIEVLDKKRYAQMEAKAK